MMRYLIFVIVVTLCSTWALKIDPPVPCQSNVDCAMFSKTENDTFCKTGFCVCKNGTEVKNCSSIDITPHDNRNTGPLVFRVCKVNQDCRFAGGSCNTTTSQCECHKDYVMSSNKQQCLKKAEGIDFVCIDEKQCLAFLANTTCLSGRCNCIPGYHYMDNHCYETVDLGNPCTQNKECSHIDGATCTKEKICGCPAETVINTDKKRCLPVAREILEKCNENVQCSTTFANSECIDKTCQCQYLFHFEPAMNRCFVNKALDENCGNNYECYQAQYESENISSKAVECLSNKCACAQDFYRQENRCVNAAVDFAGPNVLFFIALIFVCGITCRQI